MKRGLREIQGSCKGAASAQYVIAALHRGAACFEAASPAAAAQESARSKRREDGRRARCMGEREWRGGEDGKGGECGGRGGGTIPFRHWAAEMSAYRCFLRAGVVFYQLLAVSGTRGEPSARCFYET